MAQTGEQGTKQDVQRCIGITTGAAESLQSRGNSVEQAGGEGLDWAGVERLHHRRAPPAGRLRLFTSTSCGACRKMWCLAVAGLYSLYPRDQS